MSFFVVAFLSQWWMRTRYPGWFAKYNYIVAAALDGGTQVGFVALQFIMTSFTQATLCRLWFSFFRLLFKERLDRRI